MCTLLHTPHEPDTALDLYDGSIRSAYYSQHGHYGYDDFMELANRLGLVPVRASRIIEAFESRKDLVVLLVNTSFLSSEIQQHYIAYFEEKLRRLRKTKQHDSLL